MSDMGYIGDIDKTLKPYFVKIFGAYHARKKLLYGLKFAISFNDYFVNGKNLEYLSDLIPYFIDYSTGFKKGYNNFEEDCIKPYLNQFSERKDFAFKVFEYITKTIIFKHSWLHNGGGFSYTINSKENNNNKNIAKGFEDGEFQGYFYKAWCLVLANSKVYEEYFKEYYSTKNEKTIDINESINNPKTKKIFDKWYALLYLIEVEVYKKEIPTNFEGSFIKSEIEEIGKQRCKNSGQGFYRQVKDLKGNINNNSYVKRLFDNNWKDVIIKMSNNDENIIKYLDTYYK